MSALGHLMWKEYRVLRSFWLALAISGVAFQGLAMLLMESAIDRPTTFWVLAQTIVACFALGAGATQFAVEREESTYDFLRYLPLTSGQVFTSKVLMVFASTVFLALVLGASALGYAWITGDLQTRLSNDQPLGAMAVICVVVVFQGIGWGLFFSLQSARPLLAAFLAAVGGLCWLAVVQIAAKVFGLAEPSRWWGMPLAWTIGTAAVWIADAWLGLRWLHRRRYPTRIESRRATPMRNLLWQQWRTSYRLLAVLVALGLLVPGLIWPAFIPMTGLVIALMGCCTFLADQEGRQFRFFVEHGVGARRVWISRQWFWAGAGLSLAVALFLVHRLITAVLTAMPPDVEARYLFTRLRWVFDPLGYLVWIGLAFGAGQLCSMFFRSGILAAAVGVVLSSLLLGWAVLMHVLAIGFWWSVAPLIVAMFAATWLRANGWLLERKNLRAWLPPLAALAIPALTILTLVPVYRVYEIPMVESDLSAAPAPQDNAGPAATLSLLDRIRRLSLPSNRDALNSLYDPNNTQPSSTAQQWLNVDGAVLDETIDALNQFDGNAQFSDRRAISLRSMIYWEPLAALIVRSGQQAEAGGDLDLAWRRYRAALRLAGLLRRGNGATGEVLGGQIEWATLVQLPRWGAQKGQTIERLRAALDEVGEIGNRDEPLADVIRREYVEALDLLNDWQARPEEADRTAVLLSRFAPWEFARARRLLKFNAGFLLYAAQQVDSGISWLSAQNQPIIQPKFFELGRFLATTWPNLELGDLTSNRRWAVCQRGGTQLALAAEAYRLENEQLPIELAVLQGKYLEKLPDDPFYNSQFVWFPWGLRSTVRLQHDSRLPAGTPFVYTPGPMNVSNELWVKIERLRRRSADDPIARHEESPLPGGAAMPAKDIAAPFVGSMMGAPSAAGPAAAGLGGASTAAPAAAGMPAGLPAAVELTEWLPGMAFPIPNE